MGIEGLWTFLRKKGYEPVLRYRSSYLSPSSIGHNPAIRVDILGSFYVTVRHAYSSCSIDDAHCIVEREILKLGTQADLVLYVDGLHSEEKGPTQVHREDLRRKALERAEKHLCELEGRVDRKLRVRRHHFNNINKNLRSAFYWSMDARQAFAKYMREKEWNVVECLTEADLTIGLECKPGDIVVSRDSDMLMYMCVETIWRPISRDRFLVYDVASVLATLRFSRVQFTVLGIVSKNDYNHNIPSLGSATNYKIIKDLGGEDAATMVKRYLAHDQVARKNTIKEAFTASQRVFVDLLQTPLQTSPLPPSPTQTAATYDSLQDKFGCLSQQYSQNQKELQEARKAEKSEFTGAKVQRHKARQEFNRYRTIDGPPIYEADGPSEAHPALPRTRTPRQRPRYSVKQRTQRKQHEPPEVMKQYKWKPWTKLPENPLDPDAGALKKKEPKKKERETKPKQVSATTGKADLVQAMEWEHPTVTLDVGTVSANLGRALGESELVPEINRCLQDVVRIASDIKRLGQQLIGRFIDSLFAAGELNSTDKIILGNICPCVSSKHKTRRVIDASEHDEQKEV
ncbi:hypothetical protein BGZ58_003858, partial [Dissophora ornata]